MHAGFPQAPGRRDFITGISLYTFTHIDVIYFMETHIAAILIGLSVILISYRMY